LPVVERHWTDFSPGTLTPTNSPLDLALSGNGFFAVAGPSGPLYTRNGNFRLSPGGRLETQEGFPVLGPDRRPIRLDPSLPVEVNVSGGVMQQGTAVAEVGVFRVGHQDTLRKRAGTYFETTSPDPPLREESPTVHQGKLEAANFSAAEAAVRLVSVMRQFEMLQRAAQLAAEMSRRAIEEVARVGS
jgi:flagellar basal body rod protein FlgG